MSYASVFGLEVAPGAVIGGPACRTINFRRFPMINRASRAGTQIPAAELAELRESSVERIGTGDFFAGRRVILFALPGAFTPTCSTLHVPGYLARLSDFRGAGIDDIVCLSVNDPYVMSAWQHAEKAEGIRFIADPFGEFTEAMGMSVDHRDASLGTRSWRYSMLVDDGTIETMFIEADVGGDPFEVSDADTMWKYLCPNYKSAGSAFMLARHGCPHCARAKALLTENDIHYEAIHLGEGVTMQGVKAASGATTVPQVFMEGRLIGGADQLAAYLLERGAVSRSVAA
jgi:glutaredoxin-like protein